MTGTESRLKQRFASLRDSGRKALVAYLTAGDPDIQRSEAHARDILANGADVLELGIPFSDPTADGPVIQEASQRALAAGTTVRLVLEMVERLRKDFQTPIVLFGYANPLMAYGYQDVCEDAALAGADGFLVVDMPYEESGELRCHMDDHGLDFITLIAPTTPKERAQRILEKASGFVYYIMVLGVTGAREHVAAGIDEHVKMLQGCTDLPIVVGFGVRDGEQAARAAHEADGVVVGSALIQAAQSDTLVALVKDLRSGLDG